MRKVLHIAESMSGGGAESVFKNTVLGLRASKAADVHLVACNADGDSQALVNLDFSKKSRGRIHTILSQMFSYRNYRLLINFLYKETPEIIHIQNYGNLSPSILAAIYRYKAKNKVFVVQTVHTFEYICSHHAAYDYRQKRRCTDCSGQKLKFKIFHRRCSRGGTLHSLGKGLTSIIAGIFISRNTIDEWITPSEFLRQEMLKSGLPANRTLAIKNPVPSVFFEKSDNTNEAPERNNTIFYFGRLSEEKNISLLIKSFAKVRRIDPSAKLKVIGSGLEMSKLSSLRDELSLRKHIDFIPFLPQAELQKILAKGKLSVVPSKCFETASMVVLESVASGLIPVVADHGGMKEMVGWCDVGYTFRGEDEDDLSEKILSGLKNYNDEMEKLRVAKFKLEKLSLLNYAQNIIKEYDKYFGVREFEFYDSRKR